MDCDACAIGDSRSIAALCDPQSVYRELRDTRNLAEDFRRRSVRINSNGLGEALDWAAWWGCQPRNEGNLGTVRARLSRGVERHTTRAHYESER